MKVVIYFKSCLILPKFTIDIDKKIREYEGQLVVISQSFAPLSIFTSSLEAQIINLTNKIKRLSAEKEQLIRREGELRILVTPRLDTLLGA